MILNKYNLPQAIVRAYEQHQYQLQGDINCTSLIGPPQIFQLEQRHAEEIDVDIMDQAFSLFGTAIHGVLERASQTPIHRQMHVLIDKAVQDMQNHGLGEVLNEYIPRITNLMKNFFNAPRKQIYREKTFTATVNGWTLSGTPDYIEDCTLDDYKVCRAWAVKAGAKTEWEHQANVNAWLAGQDGVHIDQLRVVAFLRDWSPFEAMKDSRYPQQEIQVLPVTRRSNDVIHSYIHARIVLHQMAMQQPDEKLPECTAEERWEKPECWAVTKIQKNGNFANRAYRLCDNEESAETLAEEMTQKGPNQYGVVHRRGESTRCERYCSVQSFCHQYRRMKGEDYESNRKAA